MTPADRFFDQFPETTVLGPLGSFRLFGNFGNDFANENKYYSWTDNLSWVHGRHKTRAGAFFLTQYNWRDDLGNSRGKLFFQTFSDFLLGLSAADNLSPFGRSNIQSIQANEGVGPKGELQYHYRSYYGAGFIQDDFKASSRLTVNLGLRWEYVGPALDTTGAIGNAWPSLLQQMPHSALFRHAHREYRGRELQPQPGQPLHRPTVRRAPQRRFGSIDQQLLPEQHSVGHVRSSRWFCLAAPGDQRPCCGARRLRLVLPAAHLQRQRRRSASVHRAALCPGVHQRGLEQ